MLLPNSTKKKKKKWHYSGRRPSSHSASQSVSQTGRQKAVSHQLGWRLRQLANMEGAQKDGAKSKLAFWLEGARNKEIKIKKKKKSQPASLSSTVFVFFPPLIGL